jgi:hypothetical protein
VLAAVVAATLALAGCPPPAETTCDPPCDTAYQACRDGFCANVCPYHCGPGAYCDFSTGRCVVDYDAGEAEAGPCGQDSDDDTIPDDVEGASASPPRDTDGDTVPDHLDDDSDGDTIRDRDEEGDRDCATPPADSDADTLPDYLDLDSDGDGWPDSIEAGDDRLETRPRDTDGWGVPDFRDTDSDNDGLSDRQELAIGTNRIVEDTDGDTATDLEEWGHPGADPLDPDVGIPAGAWVERVPYNASSVRRSLVFTVDFKQIDLVLALGCSADASAALADLSAGFGSAVMPVLSERFRGARFGSLIFGDGATLVEKVGAPVARLGTSTEDASVWADPLRRLPGCADGWSAPLAGEALASAIEARGLPGYPAPPACPAGAAGITCARSGSLPLVFLMVSGVVPKPGTPPGPSGARTLDEARALFASVGARVLPVHVGPDETALTALRDLALAFGSAGPGGLPLVVRAGGGGVAAAAGLAEAIVAAGRLTFDVELVAVDLPDQPPPIDPADEVDASKFAYYIDAYRFSPAPGFSREESVSRISGATFYGSLRGVELGYRVYFRNSRVAHGPDGRRFGGRLAARTADGLVLAGWDVVFLVPATVGDVSDGR